MTAFYYTLGVLFVALGVALSIALHEIGHLVPAKKFGVRVTQYMVGFGPTLWSRQRGETEYGLKAIPLGGYIRMIGMFPPKPGEAATADSTGRAGMLLERLLPKRATANAAQRRPGLAEQARKQSAEEMQPGDERRAFYQLTVPRKVVVMLGGPSMNLLISVVLFTIIVTLFGTAQLTTTLGTVSKCVLAADAPATAQCAAGDRAAPAAAAGLKPGETILAINGQKVNAWNGVRDQIREVRGGTLNLQVKSTAGVVREVAVQPIVTDRPKFAVDGAPVLGANGKQLTERVGFLGISPTNELVPQSITAVPAVIGTALTRTAGVVLRIPQKMVGVMQAVFGSGERDPNGPISVVGASRFAGEIASTDIGDSYGPRERWADLLALVAGLNMALFVFNLIPLLPLDGGHVAGAIWEGIRRQWARVRQLPDPGPTDVARLLPVAYAVSGFLMIMSVLLIYADIVRPVRLGG